MGVTGLVVAVRNYRALQAGSFAAYASTRIRGAILDELAPAGLDERERLANPT